MKNTYLITGSYFTLNRIRNCFNNEYEQNNLPSEFYMGKYHGKYDILNQYTINDVAQLILSFIVKRLYVGDLIDVLDTERKWYLSYIEKINQDNIFVHYLGWPSKWDEWISIPSDKIRLSGQMTPGVYRNPKFESDKIYRSTIINKYFMFNIVHLNKQINIKTYDINSLSAIAYNDDNDDGDLRLMSGYYHLGKNYIIKINYRIKN